MSIKTTWTPICWKCLLMIQLVNMFMENTVLFWCVIKTDMIHTYLDKKFNCICFIESHYAGHVSFEFMILLF